MFGPVRLRKKEPREKRLKEAFESVLTRLNQGLDGDYRNVANSFSVPSTTLYDRVSKHLNGEKPAPKNTSKRYFTEAEEQLFSRTIKQAALQQLPIGRKQLLQMATNAIAKMSSSEDRSGLRQIESESTPTRGWLDGFLRRHPEIAVRVPQAANPARTIVTEARIKSWFADLAAFETSELLDGALQDPTRIFNCDEIAVPQGMKSQAVLAPKGMLNVVQKVHGSDKKFTTVLVAVQCSGQLLPPRFVFPGKVQQKTDHLPSDCHYAFSPNGWMTAAGFDAFIRETFVPFLVRENVRRPVVLFTDLHDSRLAVDLLDFLREERVVLYGLVPNATHVMQPLDLAVFRPVKCGWRELLAERSRQAEIGGCISRQQFVQLFRDVITRKASASNIAAGFRKSGIYPRNPCAPAFDKLCKASAAESESGTLENGHLGSQMPASAPKATKTCQTVGGSVELCFELVFGAEKLYRLQTESDSLQEEDRKLRQLLFLLTGNIRCDRPCDEHVASSDDSAESYLLDSSHKTMPASSSHPPAASSPPPPTASSPPTPTASSPHPPAASSPPPPTASSPHPPAASSPHPQAASSLPPPTASSPPPPTASSPPPPTASSPHPPAASSPPPPTASSPHPQAASSLPPPTASSPPPPTASSLPPPTASSPHPPTVSSPHPPTVSSPHPPAASSPSPSTASSPHPPPAAANSPPPPAASSSQWHSPTNCPPHMQSSSDESTESTFEMCESESDFEGPAGSFCRLESVSAAAEAAAEVLLQLGSKRKATAEQAFSSKRRKSVYQDIPNSNLTSRSTLSFLRIKANKRRALQDAKKIRSATRQLNARKKDKDWATKQRKVAEQMKSGGSAKRVDRSECLSMLLARANSLDCVLGQTKQFGDCFFESIQQLLHAEGSDVGAMQLRQQSCDQLVSNPIINGTPVTDFLESDFKTYIHGMRRSGTYADHVAITGLANALNRAVHVYQPGLSTPIKIVPLRAKHSGPPFRVAHIPELHYLPLLPKCAQPASSPATPAASLCEGGWALVAVEAKLRGKSHWKFYPCRIQQLDDQLAVVSACDLSITEWIARGRRPFIFPAEDDIFPAKVSELAPLPPPAQSIGRAHGWIWTHTELMAAQSKIYVH